MISKPANVLYLTGFDGEGAVLIDHKQAFLITDLRYSEAAKLLPEMPAKVIEFKHGLLDQVKALLADLNVKSLGFEADYVSFSTYRKLEAQLSPIHLVPLSGAVESLRTVKSSEELALIRKATYISFKAMYAVLRALNWNHQITETELAARLEYQIKAEGGDEAAFNVIVASGPRTSIPHAKPSRNLIESGSLLLVDVGARYKGYCSDLTRTFVIGEPSSLQKEIYNAVCLAHKTALQSVRPGIKASEVNEEAEGALRAAGYAHGIRHSLGHGVGLEVHELPTLSAKSSDELRPGMTVTIEPGVYLEGWGGVRVEDLVEVNEYGASAITYVPNKLALSDWLDESKEVLST